MNEFEKDCLIKYLESLKVIINTYDIEELVSERDKYCAMDLERIDKIIEEIRR